MDWTIRNFASKSDLSGTPFGPGDRVVSVLMRPAGQPELARVDCLESEMSQLPAGTLLGRWTVVLRDDHEGPLDKRERRIRKLVALEEFFHSLRQSGEGEEEPEEASSDRALLLYLSALTLERKRILRLRERESSLQRLRYQHAQREETYDIEVVQPTAEQLGRVQEALSELL